MFSSAAGSCWNAGGQRMSGVEAERVVTCSGKRRGRAEVGCGIEGLSMEYCSRKGCFLCDSPAPRRPGQQRQSVWIESLFHQVQTSHIVWSGFASIFLPINWR